MASANPLVPSLELVPLHIQLPCRYRGVYCSIHEIPGGIQGLPAGRLVKIRRLNSPAQRAGFRNMLTALLSERAANPAAFRHRYISWFEILDVAEIFGHVGQSMLALVTPLYENGDIVSYGQHRSYATRLSWVIQAATALEHLHRHHKVHGNVYPGNILITDHEEATLTDISVYTKACTLVLAHATIPIQESFVYQSREYIYPGTDGLNFPTKPTDVYAMGSSIYSTFTGNPPFHGRFDRLEHAIVEIVRHGHLRLPKPSIEIISDNLWDLIQGCWALDPAARPEMAEVVTALEYVELYE